MKKLLLLMITLTISGATIAGVGSIRDDRTPIWDLKKESPALGQLLRYTPTGSYYCSAIVVSPTLILSAGHCVRDLGFESMIADYNFRLRDSEKDLEIREIIGFDYDGTGAEIPPEKSDWALLRLSEPISIDNYPELTSLNELTSSKSKGELKSLRLDVLGFPGEKQMGGFRAKAYVHKGCPISVKHIQQEIFIAKCDVSAGQSGGPVFISGTNKLVGIVSGGGFFFLRNDARVFSIDSQIDFFLDIINDDFKKYGDNGLKLSL